MFIREKVDQMRATGSSFKEICEFQRAYHDGISHGKNQAQALEYSEQTISRRHKKFSEAGKTKEGK